MCCTTPVSRKKNALFWKWHDHEVKQRENRGKECTVYTQSWRIHPFSPCFYFSRAENIFFFPESQSSSNYFITHKNTIHHYCCLIIRRVNLLICLNPAACSSPADKQARGLFSTHLFPHIGHMKNLPLCDQDYIHNRVAVTDCQGNLMKRKEGLGGGYPTRCLKIAVTSCSTVSWTKNTADGWRTEGQAVDGASKVTGRSRQSSRRQCVSLQWLLVRTVPTLINAQRKQKTQNPNCWIHEGGYFWRRWTKI